MRLSDALGSHNKGYLCFRLLNFGAKVDSRGPDPRHVHDLLLQDLKPFWGISTIKDACELELPAFVADFSGPPPNSRQAWSKSNALNPCRDFQTGCCRCQPLGRVPAYSRRTPAPHCAHRKTTWQKLIFLGGIAAPHFCGRNQ